MQAERAQNATRKYTYGRGNVGQQGIAIESAVFQQSDRNVAPLEHGPKQDRSDSDIDIDHDSSDSHLGEIVMPCARGVANNGIEIRSKVATRTKKEDQCAGNPKRPIPVARRKETQTIVSRRSVARATRARRLARSQLRKAHCIQIRNRAELIEETGNVNERGEQSSNDIGCVDIEVRAVVAVVQRSTIVVEVVVGFVGGAPSARPFGEWSSE
jgi:hypothetical protein